MAIGTPPDALPRWDLNTIFPSIDSPEFVSATSELVELVNTVEGVANTLGESDSVAMVDTG